MPTRRSAPHAAFNSFVHFLHLIDIESNFGAEGSIARFKVEKAIVTEAAMFDICELGDRIRRIRCRALEERGPYLEALFLTIFAVVYLSKAHSSSVRTSVSFVVSPQILKIRRLILFYFFPLHFPISCTIAAKQQMGATLTSLAVGFWVVRD